MNRTQRCLLLIACLGMSATAVFAQKRSRYEYYKDIPAYVDSIQNELTYPMAWGNSRETDFDKWRTLAREKVLECMMTPPPAASSYNYKVITEEQRDGYKALKVEFRLSAYYTVRAYILVPDGKGPFPAINLLHDHGGHLFIGKEKMIRPIDEDSVVVEDADRWQDVVYGGQYMGDFLARHGYVVFSTDAPHVGRARTCGGRRPQQIRHYSRQHDDARARSQCLYDIRRHCRHRLSRHSSLCRRQPYRLCRMLHGGIQGMDAVGTVRQNQGWCLGMLDGYDRRTDDMEVRTQGKRRLCQLHSGTETISRLSPYCLHGMSQAHAFHKRGQGQAVSVAGREEGI